LIGLNKRVAITPVLFNVWILAACSAMPQSASSYGSAPGPFELVDTPFYSQLQFQCGPAALITLLEASGVATTLEAVSSQIYLPARQGSLQSEIIAATRAADRIPYVLAPALASIAGELAAGRCWCCRTSASAGYRGGIMQWSSARMRAAMRSFFVSAERLYIDMLSEDSSSLLARNNLAMTLVALVRNDRALEQIDIALVLAEGSPLLDELQDTKKLL
jgi:hypothetical protein